MGSFKQMSSDDKDVIILYNYIQQRRNRKRYRLNPYIEKNINCRLFVAVRELVENEYVFHICYRMSKNSYQNLVKW